MVGYTIKETAARVGVTRPSLTYDRALTDNLAGKVHGKAKMCLFVMLDYDTSR